MKRREAQGGFTLTELLVSTAIFAILMTSIAALFIASLHAVRAGYQSQEAFETSRGTFNVIERDLTTMFTSRNFGQYYQFYGNEYGMMMVGLVQERDSSGREFSRLGRITYVIYPVVLRGADGAFYVTEPFQLDYAKNVGVTDTGRAPDFYQTRGVRYSDVSASNPDSDAGALEVAVCALVRYIEPGVSDLDSYPFDWDVLIDETENNPEFPQGANAESIRSQLDASLETTTAGSDPSGNPAVLARLDSGRDQMLAAKKRDLWIRMLSCQKYWIPKLVGGAPLLPNPWGRINLDKSSASYGQVYEPCWLAGGPGQPVKDPRDYIAVDNIGVFTNDDALNTLLGFAGHQDYWTTWPLMAYAPKSELGYRPFLEYGRVSADTTPDLVPFWNSNRRTYIGDCSLLLAGVDYDQDGVAGELGEHLVIAGTTDPAVLLIDPFAYEKDGRDNDADATVDEPGETFTNPIDRDNLDNDGDGDVDEGADGADNDSDTQVDEPDESEMVNSGAAVTPPAAPADAQFASYGSPWQPRLPEVVMVRLPMVFDPAYVKAPNFERRFEQLIEVPTAYTRSRLAYGQP